MSDHCAIVLKTVVQNWGPRPFRVMNCWLLHNDFERFVSDKWKELRVQRWGSFVIKEKLKLLKQHLKVWNTRSFGNMDDKIQQATKDIKQLDDKGELRSLSDGDNLKRRELFESLWNLSKM